MKLCSITSSRKDISYEEQVTQACKGGVDAIRFSDASLPVREIVELGRKLRDICRRNKALFLIDERPDIALAVSADGVHLTLDSIPAEWARQVLGPRILIGISVTSLGQALAAAEAGAGYISVGPMFSQQQGVESTGVDIIRMIKKRVKAPVLAEGSITLEHVADVVKAGADGIIIKDTIAAAASVELTARQIKERILQTETEQGNLLKE